MGITTQRARYFDPLRKELPRKATEMAHDGAEAAQASYRGQMRRGHGLLTGGMQSAAYVVSQAQSDYAEATADARGRNTEDEPLPEVARPPLGQAILADAEPYALPVNDGHIVRDAAGEESYVAGYHMLEQAFDDVRPLLPAIMARRGIA